MLKLKKLAILSLAAIGLASPALADGAYFEGEIRVLPQPTGFGVRLGYETNGAFSTNTNFDIGSNGAFFAKLSSEIVYSIPLLSGPDYGLSFQPAGTLYADIAPDFGMSLGIKPQLRGYYNLGPSSYTYFGLYFTIAQLGFGNQSSFVISETTGRRGVYAGAKLTTGAFSINPEIELSFPTGINLEARLQVTYDLNSRTSIYVTGGYDGNISYNTGGLFLRINGRYSF